MFNKLTSFIKGAGLVLDYMYDNAHRIITGLPRLRRSQITAQLFLGSQYNLVGLRKLKALGVTAIVNMRMHTDYSDAEHEGIKYLHLPTVDNTPPPLEVLLKGADFIDNEIKNSGIVYVHCRQGLGRGPTMAMAYLIKTGLTFEAAYAMVKRVRIFINPRPGQIEMLKELEDFYQNMGATSLKDRYQLSFYYKVFKGKIYHICDPQNLDYACLSFLSFLHKSETEGMIWDLEGYLRSQVSVNDDYYSSDSVEDMTIKYEYPNVILNDVLTVPMPDLLKLLKEWLKFTNLSK